MSTVENKPRIPRSRIRARIRRHVAAAEGEEHEGGELNLVPFLDILVNTIIFLLATSAVALPMASINVSTPRYVPQGDEDIVEAGPGRRSSLTIAISRSGFIVAGRGGALRGADGQLPTVRCATSLQDGRCPVYARNGSSWVDRYDYPALSRVARKLKSRHSDQRKIHLTADQGVPYRVIVQTMDALRGTATAKCTSADGCLFDQVVLGTGIM